MYLLNRIHAHIPFVFTTNVSLLKANNEWRLYNKYRNKYKKIIIDNHYENISSKQSRDSEHFKFWTLWLQGEDQAPPLVRKCFNQIRSFYGENRLVILDSNSIEKYVCLPDFIVTKYKQGKISMAHYSDIVRTFLLCEYGGVWIDSTCFMTAPLPEEIFNCHEFFFRMPKCFPGAIKASSWFILSEKKTVIMCMTRDLLVEYWNTHNSLEDYLLYHIFFSIAADSSENARKEWESIPYYNNDTPHIMQRELLNPASPERIAEVSKMSFIHKLNWRFKGATEGTNFEYLISK